ncbi:hypothetical protein [Paraburkholderia acidisoli]|uniref:Phage baseplate assembly protein V n=2 Tax=Paraburkholderia acidisoli TaxID=2571748 RepID=A0A7Z2JJK6_9BURK|nr:hypothetical protein [Paraburkholderia acidisoli]QGZ66353.1 hypothetical protein FAZ98_31670 [Paraburkholderia acidisoli]
MSDDFSKLWLQGNLNQVAITRAQQAIKSLGRALPCRVTSVTGKIVTVEFQMDTTPWTLPPITIPKAESQWLTEPTQIGDEGMTMPADAYLGGISGLGGGNADFRQRGNLTALVFVPVGNKSFSPIDPNAAQIQGPNGTILRTTAGASSIVTNTDGTTITCESTTLVVNASGITLTVGGQTFTWGGTQAVSTLPIKAPDVVLPNGAVNEHNHGNVQNGGGVTDPMQN